METLEHNPGLLYVAATLLPLASFVLLLVLGGLRNAFRPYRSGGGIGATLYHAFGGDQPTRLGAYVATAAIAGAFLLSAAGLVWYLNSQPGHNRDHDHSAQAAEHKHAEAKEDDHERGLEVGADRWADRAEWIRIGAQEIDPRAGVRLEVGYRIDGLSAVMFAMVTFIATLIHLFSAGYMAEEKQLVVEDHSVHGADGGHHQRVGRFSRFFMYLSLFCFSMLNLILADNLFQIFVSWELVGVCSFFLIGFYYERQSASNAANKAFITNRIGDAGFIIGMLIIWTFVGSFNFQDIFQRVRAPERDSHNAHYKLENQLVRVEVEGEATEKGRQTFRWSRDGSGSHVALFPLNPGHLHGIGDQEDQVQTISAGSNRLDRYGAMPYWLLTVAGLGIFLGCVGKSAQFPLQVWLPDAMEGPTPVSALIHAATMVAAGVYLVGRVFPLFTPEARLTIAYVGAITLFVAATIAIVMHDIKKVLAYSTVSQLGYMMLALGIGGWVAGLLHLLTHAFFKALLFLGSGSVIHGCHHEQDMRKMGGLFPKMRITAITMLIGVLAIAGTPLFSGWYSKDAIIAQALGFASVHKQHMLLLILPLVTAGITCFYMLRMWFLTFAGRPKDHRVHDRAHESPWLMTAPLILLAIFSVCVAWGWPLWDADASFLGHVLHNAEPKSVHADFAGVVHHIHESGWVHPMAGLLALGAAVVGAVFAALVYYYHALDPAETKEQFPLLHRLFDRKWYFDELYSAALVRPALVVAHWCRAMDTRGIDWIINGIGRATVAVARFDGLIDKGIVDGLVNVLANAIRKAAYSFRRVQTGLIRNYVLFLVLAAVGIFAALSSLARGP